MIRIDLKSLEPGIHNFEWMPSAEELELDSEAFKNLHVSARLDFSPSRIFVTLQTNASAHLICDRTLVKYDEVIDGEYSLLFASGDLLEGEMGQDDDIRRLDSVDEEIDLTDLVRDTFILSVPARKIAPGAEGEEIPLRFGIPESGAAAVDPRWEALRKLSSQGSDGDQEFDEE